MTPTVDTRYISKNLFNNINNNLNNEYNIYKNYPIINNSIINNTTTDNYLKNNFNILENQLKQFIEDHMQNLQTTIKNLETQLKELARKNHTLSIEVEEYKELATPETTCSICLTNKKDHANTTCGHLCVCSTCVEKVDKCPICRTEGNWCKIFS
jgi:hypothetical protein